MKKIIFQSLVFCLTILTFSSCVNQKQIAYFQKGINQSDTIQIAKAYIPKIQSGDILAINVGSLNPIASSFFNPYASMPISTEPMDNNNGITASTALTPSATPGYLISSDGTIDLPLIGSIKLAGLTTTEAKGLIKTSLKKYLKEPTVNVRFMNYKISVMGEVVKPAIYVIPNEKITLPEALSLAGDLTIFGKRDNVLVIRDIDGKKTFERVNLNTREVYSSPFYYLHNNDVIYVEPSGSRVLQTDRTIQFLPIVLSALSLLVIIIRK